ncbi:hypothetical protein [Qipengyuania qiaonensis]|uniref:Ribbon-helix-helix protein, CopG family n=1 Tax=Qipengyuania qiaonensis TaxID=2867240 RepID=A0ABS7J5R3_9SPHN|nr:hypothetical protein [Qipengyuania qiaonensis]MBX7480958.1 hypothetical protein [Qipengyuania qiaonensis]
MQTERVTYLTNAEQKAALEAFAKARGESVGSVLREAAARYMAEPDDMSEAEEAALNMLSRELEEAVPRWNAKMDSIEASIAQARKAVREALERVEATK